MNYKIYNSLNGVLKKKALVLAGVAQCIEHWPGDLEKGHWFDSQSGQMPGLQARSPVEGV